MADGPAAQQGRGQVLAGCEQAGRVGLLLMPDDVVAVLDVVVQWDVDVADRSRHEGVQGDPVIVVGRAEPLGEGQDLSQQRGPEQARGAHDGIGRHETRERRDVVAA